MQNYVTSVTNKCIEVLSWPGIYRVWIIGVMVIPPQGRGTSGKGLWYFPNGALKLLLLVSGSWSFRDRALAIPAHGPSLRLPAQGTRTSGTVPWWPSRERALIGLSGARTWSPRNRSSPSLAVHGCHPIP